MIKVLRRHQLKAKQKFRFLAGCAAVELLTIGREMWPNDEDVPCEEAA